MKRGEGLPITPTGQEGKELSLAEDRGYESEPPPPSTSLPLGEETESELLWGL